jgi:hypothetical protein
VNEGALARATLTPTPDWLEQLCGWVRRPPGDVGPLVWPVVLMPQRIASTAAFPDDARTVYQRVRWTTTLPAGPLDLQARAEWVASRPEGSEIGVGCSASSTGTLVADGEVVIRTGQTLAGWGVPDTPAVPSGEGMKRRRSFALSEHDVAAFAELSGVHEPIHEDAAHAWRLGLANALVQEVTLLLIVMHVAASRGPGSVEMWFPGVVPVGSLLTLWQGPATWDVRLAGARQPVAVARLTERIGRMTDAHEPRERDA